MTATPPTFPTAAPPRPFCFTREQYYEMGRLGFFYRARVERIHGRIFEMSPINWPHVVGCRKTAIWLEGAFAGAGWVSRNEQPLALTDSDPQPDIIVVAGRFEDFSGHPTTALLVVEVSDTTLDYDLTTKAELYATDNIPEYWVLDVDNRQLHVFRDPQPHTALGVTAYRTHLTLGAADSVSPLAAPHASVAVSALLP